LACVVEEAAGVDDGSDFAEWFEGVDFAGGIDGHGGGVEVDGDVVAGVEDVAEAVDGFAGVELAGGDTVAEEDPGEAFGKDDAAGGGAEGDGCVFAGAAAAEITAGDDDGELGIELVRGDEPYRVEGVGKAAEGVAAEFFVFVGDGGYEIEVLGGYDLVGVDVIAHDIHWPAEDGLHGVELWRRGWVNSIRFPVVRILAPGRGVRIMRRCLTSN
jgi:hypothetical protein